MNTMSVATTLSSSTCTLISFWIPPYLMTCSTNTTTSRHGLSAEILRLLLPHRGQPTVPLQSPPQRSPRLVRSSGRPRTSTGQPRPRLYSAMVATPSTMMSVTKSPVRRHGLRSHGLRMTMLTAPPPSLPWLFTSTLQPTLSS